jgi:hypothetical protein
MGLAAKPPQGLWRRFGIEHARGSAKLKRSPRHPGDDASVGFLYTNRGSLRSEPRCALGSILPHAAEHNDDAGQSEIRSREKQPVRIGMKRTRPVDGNFQAESAVAVPVQHKIATTFEEVDSGRHRPASASAHGQAADGGQMFGQRTRPVTRHMLGDNPRS